MKSPHVSPEPLPFLPDRVSNLTGKSSSCSTGSLKTGSWAGKVAGHMVYKKKNSSLTKENLDEFNRHGTSPYYKGLLFQEKVSGTSSEAENTTPTPIAHDFQDMSSPYYKGLLYTEKVQGTVTTLEAESIAAVAVAAAAIPHDFTTSYSPYYKGLLNQATSPDRESVAATTVSSSSRTSFSVKMPELGCFKFKAKDEKPPTMVKVYSTESSNQESLRERGSEPTSPQLSPPLPPQSTSPPPSPPPPPLISASPTKKVVVTAKDDTIEPKEGNKYVWADRHRPVTLMDFICNKDKAIELKSIIKCSHHSP